MHEVEDKGPAPDQQRYTGKYPWGRMEVGDSFAVEEEMARNVRSAGFSRSRSYPGEKYVVRMDVNGEYRCWRIK